MKIVRLKSTESTNHDCFNLLRTNDSVFVISETQTKGRGRNINKWESPKGNIYLSVGKVIDISRLSGLSQRVSVGIFKYLNTIIEKDNELKLKWPNDIYYKEKKLSGVLVETKISGKEAVTVIGVGLNYKSAPIKDSISLIEYTNASKEEVEMGIFESCLNAFEVGNFEEILYFFNNYNFFEKGDQIVFKINDKFEKGVFIGITKSMEISVKVENKVLTLNSAEVKKLRTI